MHVFQFSIQNVETLKRRATAMVWVREKAVEIAEQQAREHLQSTGWVVEETQISLTPTVTEIRRFEPASRQAHQTALASGICALIVRRLG